MHMKITPSPDLSLKAVLAALAGNSIVTCAKFIGWSASLSPSMLAEAVHSLADTLNQFLLLIGIRHGSGQPTKAYPFGKGQARYIWNLISAMGIFFMGFGVTVYHGIFALLSGGVADPNASITVPVLILGFSLMVESYSLHVAYQSVQQSRGDTAFWRYVRTGDDPTGVAVLLEDAIAVVGVIVGLSGILLSRKFQSPVPDAVASILIGFLLGGMAVVLAIANGRILMGASAGSDWDTEIREFVESFPSVERVVSLKTSVLAPGRFRASIEVEFHGGILVNRQQIEKDADSIRDGDDPVPVLVETAERMVRTVGREINRLEAEIHKRFPQVVVIDLEVN